MDKFEVSIILILLALVGVAIYIAFTFTTDGGQCVANPLQYGVRDLIKKFDYNAHCVCSLNSPTYKPFIVTSNDTIFI